MKHEDIVEHKLQPAIRECQLHLKRLEYAVGQLKKMMPLNADVWDSLDNPTVASIDQLLFRFVKLQDAMGARLFPAILMAVSEWDESQTFLDKLHRLHKIGALPSVSEWLELRELRILATHEYPDAPEKNAETVNLIHESVDQLSAIFSEAIKFSEPYINPEK